MHQIRFATEADLELLAGIEDDADRLLVERFQPSEWGTAPTGTWRAAQPGFLLVAEEDEVVGFAHVLEVGGAHLEQVSVRPRASRRGIGAALVTEALAEAERRGHPRVTLRTFADVPWNAPFYGRLGFVESEPDTPWLRELVLVEQRLGLDRHGRRVQMTASTG